MIELLRDALSPSEARQFDSEAFQATFANFATWVGIFGSDEAVTAFRNLMQCTYHDAPALVMLRLYGDFVVAARRDMGDPDTTTTVDEVLGIRLKDLYSDARLRYVLSGPIGEVCESLEWEPPWTRED